MLGYLVNMIYPFEQYMEEAKILDFSLQGWIFKIMMRDVIFAFTLISCWYYILDVSRVNVWIKPLKFNPHMAEDS